MTHDPGAYGRHFSEVYDDWYGDAPIESVVRLVHQLVGPAACILELGVGTGRLALPLAAAGHRVNGIDSSLEMIAVLRGKPGGSKIDVTVGDVADATSFPDARFDAVVAAFNLIFNLADRSAQRRCLVNAATAMDDDGVLIVEAFVPEPMAEATRDLVTRSVTADGVILIATETDPAATAVRGAHIELRDGSVRVRPWRVCVAMPGELDDMATEAGLRLVHRYASWTADEFVEGASTNHVSVYRRSRR